MLDMYSEARKHPANFIQQSIRFYYETVNQFFFVWPVKDETRKSRIETEKENKGYKQ